MRVDHAALWFLLLASPVAAYAQPAIENWAVPTGMSLGQTVSVLSELNQPLLNRPFSATATVHVTHTLEDGIHIDQTTTAVMYRDAQGRQRTEGDGSVSIVDPVAQAGMTLDTARRIAIVRSVSGFVPTPEILPVRAFSETAQTKTGRPAMTPGGVPVPRQITTENLGSQTINGVLCYGGRKTITIPAGAIANDREIKSITETWTSADLHILVRSIDSDPRSGTSTYELTNIIRAAPDPALFLMDVPAGYTERQQQKIQGRLVLRN
jgi:hypothetical protein